MSGQKNEGSAGVLAVVIFVFIIIALVLTNRWFQKQADDIASNPVDTSPVKPLPPKSQEETVREKKRTGEVIRKTRLSPGRLYEINRFYQGGEEVASFKSSKGEIYDRSGKIPDGKVKFINESNGTYGAEYYRDGERNGPAKTYYKDGALRKDTYYQFGKLMTNTEYFHDGIVRMEEDYSDARDSRGEKEVGVGKVYFRNGTLKYEWFMTVTEPIGYKKSYNSKGNLVAEFYFDEYGRPIELQKTPNE